MRRRKFAVVLGGAALWPLALRAEPKTPPTIGFLGPLSSSAQRSYAAAFERRLAEIGWTPGGAVAIEYRWAEGRRERFSEIAAEFVRLKVDVIVTGGTAAVLAVKQATSVIPIVFAVAADPVGTGLVASLARPGGNATGLSNQSPELAGKRLELLREMVPGLRRLAIMANAGSPVGMLDAGEIKEASKAFGFEVIPVEIRRAEDIDPAVKALKGRADGLDVVTDPLMNTNRAQIGRVALEARLPTMHGVRDYVEAAGLMSYGVSFSGSVRARRRVCRQDPARSEPRRPSRRAADQIRSGDQSQNG